MLLQLPASLLCLGYVLNEVSNPWMTNFQANICFPLKKKPQLFSFFFLLSLSQVHVTGIWIT